MIEKTLFLLCIEDSLEEIMSVFCDYFAIENSGEGYTLNLKNGNVELNIDIITKNMNKDFITDQIRKIWGYFRQVDAQETNIKINLLHQIKCFNSFISINCKHETGQDFDMITDTVLDIMKNLKCLLLINDGRTFVNKENEIVLNDSGETEVSSFMPYKQIDEYKFFCGVLPEQIERRNKSIEILRERNIYTMEWLPLIESKDKCHFRTAEEIAGRAACLLVVALYSECLLGEKMPIEEAREFVSGIMKAFDCDKYFSPKEKVYLNNYSPSEQEQISFSWQYENLIVMEWALGFIDKLDFPANICDVSLSVRIMKNFNSIGDILKNACMRSHDEILDENDFIFRIDWACVDARLNGLSLSGVEAGVVQERHKALNWLVCFGDDDWDNVDIST